jgi:hypothetical protein
MRESDYDESVRLREEAIKWLADRRIESMPHGTLINMGSRSCWFLLRYGVSCLRGSGGITNRAVRA